MAGEPLIMLSGMLGDSTTWKEVASDLADVAEPAFCRIDRDDSITAMAETALAEAPPRCALVGHSLGGIVALEMVRQAPDRITRLALVNTSGRGPSEAQIEAWRSLAARTQTGEFVDVADELALHTLPEIHRQTELVTRNRKMADTVGADGFVRQLTAQATRPDSRPWLATIAVPTLVVSGGLDGVCPVPLQRELADGIPGARHVVIAAAGHMSPLEAPRPVASALRAWLGE